MFLISLPPFTPTSSLSLSLPSLLFLSVLLLLSFLSLFFNFFLPCHMASRILVLQPGFGLGLMSVKALSPNRWMLGNFPPFFLPFLSLFFLLGC